MNEKQLEREIVRKTSKHNYSSGPEVKLNRRQTEQQVDSQVEASPTLDLRTKKDSQRITVSSLKDRRTEQRGRQSDIQVRTFS